jgi:plasmid stabilization system protein ParE
MNHRISPLADTDIDSIWNYVAQDNPAAADRVEQEIQEAIEKLAKNPNFGHFRDDIAPRQ